MGYAIQDTARQTAYGLGQLRYLLKHRPNDSSAMHEYVDETEHIMLGLIGSPELLEPLIIIAGGGLEKEQVNAGRIATSKFIRLVTREYFERLEAAGLDGRSKRSRIPAVISRIEVAE